MKELRYALRMIARNPALSLVAVISLALGIGANTTMFSFAEALLFRMPPVAAPQRLAEVWTHDTSPNAALNGMYPLSYLDWKDISAQSRSFTGLAIYSPGAEASVRTGGAGSEAAAWTGQLVSANYFEVLGIQPALGRWFLPEEGATPGSSPVVVLAYTTWQERFGGERSVLGRQVTMNGLPYTVIGVAPRGFTGLFGGLECDFWAPVTMSARMGGGGVLTNRGSRSLLAVGRLKPGVTFEAATADVDAIQRRLDHQYPNQEGKFGGKVVAIGMMPTPFRGFVTAGTGLLAVVVGLVLLIACANAALVLLVEAVGRRREWAIRAALGASRGRLVRQGLLHSVLLALAAGGLGLGLARVLGPALVRLAPPGFPITIDLNPDGRVLLFTLLVAVATGVLFGLAPAWQGARRSVTDALKDGTPGGGAARSLARSLFIAGQVALCVVVLVGAALCLRSLEHANAIDPGFDTQHLVIANLDPESLGYSGDTAKAFLRRIESAVGTIPGVEAVSYTTSPPLQLSVNGTEVLAPGMRPPAGKTGYDSDTARVGADYFRASGTRLLEGRDFTASDLAPGRGHYAVINQTLERELFPHGDAVGRELLYPGDKNIPSAEIVGIAQDGKYRSLGEPPRPFVYQLDDVGSPVTLLMHVAGNPRAFQPAIARALEGLDANLTGDNVQTVGEYLQVPLFPARFTGILLGGFGALALLLAIVGLYGVIAASVAQRTREYGVRMALGASAGTLYRLVIGQGVRLTLYGIAAGLALAAVATHFMAALLYGLSPVDPVSYAAAAGILVAVAVAASYVPARRAAGVDPLVALRWE